MRRCVISLANERGNYYKCLDRLESAMGEYNPDIDFFGYRSEMEVGAPKHVENPYAFKVYAIEKALSKGYTQILWLDSSCYCVSNLQPLFGLINRDGYAMQEAGAFVGDWCNDETLKYFGISRVDAKSMLMYGNAGLLGLDFKNETATAFFLSMGQQNTPAWKEYQEDLTDTKYLKTRAEALESMTPQPIL